MGRRLRHHCCICVRLQMDGTYIGSDECVGEKSSIHAHSGPYGMRSGSDCCACTYLSTEFSMFSSSFPESLFSFFPSNLLYHPPLSKDHDEFSTVEMRNQICEPEPSDMVGTTSNYFMDLSLENPCFELHGYRKHLQWFSKGEWHPINSRS